MRRMPKCEDERILRREHDLAVLERLLEICDLTPFELDECLCIGDAANAAANRSAFTDDPVGFEAFVNHVHLVMDFTS